MKPYKIADGKKRLKPWVVKINTGVRNNSGRYIYKNCTATKKLAEKAGIPSLLIFYDIPVTRLRVTILTPKYKAERIIKPYTLVRYLKKLQSTHVCNKIIN